MFIPEGTGQFVELVSLNKFFTVSVTESPLTVTDTVQLASLINYPICDWLVSTTGLFK